MLGKMTKMKLHVFTMFLDHHYLLDILEEPLQGDWAVPAQMH